MRYRAIQVSLALVASLLVTAGTNSRVLANGQEFFAPAGEGKVTLVYFGSVKDQDGKPMEDVEFIVDVTDQSMFPFAFRPDAPGHFRSPDIGEIYKAAGHDFNPRVVTLTAKKEGYKLVVRRVPLRKEGVYGMDFRMEKIVELAAPAAQAAGAGGAAVEQASASQAAATAAAGSEGGLPGWTWMLGAVLLVLAIGAVVRKSGRRQSIGY